LGAQFWLCWEQVGGFAAGIAIAALASGRSRKDCILSAYGDATWRWLYEVEMELRQSTLI